MEPAVRPTMCASLIWFNHCSLKGHELSHGVAIFVNLYLRQVNRVNGEDTVFILCLSVCMSVRIGC